MNAQCRSVDSFHSYLSELRDRPLLSPGEEVDWALRLESARLELCSALGQVPWRALSAGSADESSSCLESTPEPDEAGGDEEPTGESSAQPAPASGLSKMVALGAELAALSTACAERDRCRERLQKVSSRSAQARWQKTLETIELDLRTKLDGVMLRPRELEAMIRWLRAAVRTAAAGLPRGAASRRDRARARFGQQLGMPVSRLVELRRAVDRAYSDAHDAQRALVESNLRLVVHHAKPFACADASLEDLVQEGNLGLMRAVDKFNPRLGFRFSTYASWWIRQAITRALPEHARTIRLPVHVLELQRRIRGAERSLEQQLRRAPTAEEIALEAELPTDKVRQLLDAARDATSLDAPVGPEGTRSVGESIALPWADGADVEAERQQVASQTRELLEALPPREALVLRLRFGVETRAPHTLQEIGDLLGVTRERARQIEAKALRRLKPAARYRALAD